MLLVAYISKTGTTAAIAEGIRAKLAPRYGGAECLPLDKVADLGKYDKVIVGAPVNGMKLRPELKTFLDIRSGHLKDKVVAVFAVSYMYHNGRRLWRRMIDKDLRAAASAAGADTSFVFNGRIADPLPGFARAIFGTPKDLALDARDPAEIESFVAALTS